MLKKLCVVFVGFGLCIGVMGCGGNKPVELPKDKMEKPAEKPTNQTQSIEAPE